MSKLKILIPLDGSEKSMHSLNWLKNLFTTEEAEVTLLHVLEVMYYSDNSGTVGAVDNKDFDIAAKTSDNSGQVGTVGTGGEGVSYDAKNAELLSNKALDEVAKTLEGYAVNTLSTHGSAPDSILKKASEGKYDMIIMTKSNVKGIARIIGSVTTKVVRNSEIPVIVVPE